MIKRQIPNLITLGNLFCGVESIFAALVQNDVMVAALWICGGIFLDFFAPAFIMFRLVEVPMKELIPLWGVILVMIPFLLMPLFSAYRLAKFNIDTRQSHSFLGLPVPANALIWVGIALAGLVANSLTLAIVLAVVAMITNILMVSEMPMFSLKFNFKDMSWKSNSTQYIFLAGCIVTTD